MLKYLIEKEFKQIFRNPFLPKIIIMMPLLVMLVMPWAVNQEIKSIKLSVVDNDHSTLSGRLVRKAASSGYFKLVDVSDTYNEALESIESGEADMILEIENGFERNMINDGMGRIMISANSVNGTKGTLGSSYLSSVVGDFVADVRADGRVYISSASSQAPSFNVTSQYRFNPHLDYKLFMIPALVVMLLNIICGFLPALNVVGEKEAGTIEQINVTPVNKLVFVFAKLIPYWIIGFIVLSICMLLAAFVYGIVPAGSLFNIYLFASVYLLVVSGLGLIVSNYSNTMQQALFVMFFFIMIFLLMSGLFTPIASMPKWAQAITVVNPLKYFMQVMRQIYMKGSSFAEMLPQFLSLCAFVVVINVWAVLSYRKSG